MWYIADIVLAKKPSEPKPTVVCESCDVLFEAVSAREAYQKALSWAKEYTKEGDFHLLGITSIWDVGDEQPGDGTELSGSFFEEVDPWGRINELIPDPNDIRGIELEDHLDTPVGQLMTDEQKRMAERLLDEE